MKRAILAGVAFLALCSAAFAQSAGPGWAGYVYPSSSFGTAAGKCSSPCTTMSVEWDVPTITYSGSGAIEDVYVWIGMSGNISSNADANNCPGYNCLAQFGTFSQVTTGSVITYGAWKEIQCPAGGSSTPIVCETVQDITGMTINGGDHIVVTMSCVTNCSAYSSSMKASAVLLDVTSGVTCYITPSHTCGTQCTTGAESACLNWPLSFDHVDIVVEQLGAHAWPNFSAIPFTNFLVNGVPIVITNIQSAAVVRNQSSRTAFPSQLLNGGNSFNICRATGSYSATTSFCPVGIFSGTAGMAVQ